LSGFDEAMKTRIEAMTRAAAARDISGIRELDDICRLTPWSMLSYRELMDRPTVHFLVAEIERRDRFLVGFQIVSNLDQDSEVLKIAVHPEYQGTGVAQLLLEAGLYEARRLGCRKCYLEVRPSNHRAIRFYGRNGFEIVDLRKNYYTSPMEDAFVMRKNLRSKS
jgi:[ribosomal protein S18]-alanine N-acetyltransferase